MPNPPAKFRYHFPANPVEDRPKRRLGRAFNPHERTMSPRQALFRSAVRLYSSPAIQGWKTRISALMLPFWPSGTLNPAQIETRARLALISGEATWRIIAGPLDINGGSGLLYRGRTRLDPAGYQPSSPVAPDDLTLHFGGRVIRREPALVLHNGPDGGIGVLATEILPRLCALDRLGLPADILLLVTRETARTRFFQRALRDGVFRPRPVEILRPSTAVRTDEVHLIDLPALDAGLLALSAERLVRLYGPFDREGAALVLAEGTRECAMLTTWRDRASLPAVFAHARLIDIETTHLGDLIRALAGAPAIAGPARLLEAIALAPRRDRLLMPIDAPSAALGQLARLQGETLAALT
jgi:hypothetical protein